jgi:hypothetical protein
MGKPKGRKKAAAATMAAAPAVSPLAIALVEESLFEPDEEIGNNAKNRALATLLGGPWKGLAIVRVERIEIGDSGWRVVYRE